MMPKGGNRPPKLSTSKPVDFRANMATPVPWQFANAKPPTIKKVQVYARDLYNFTYRSTTQGTNNPVVPIPSMGPHAAGAIPPSMFPQVIATQITVCGTNTAGYGANNV